MRPFENLCLCVLAASLLASCAPAYKARFDMTAADGIFWPGKPEKPRIKYLWSLYNLAEDTGKSFLDVAAGRKTTDMTDPSAAQRLLRPQAVYADEKRFYFADPGAPRVVVVDKKTMDVMSIVEADGMALEYPISVVSGENGNIYVSDPEIGKVAAYSEGGKFLFFFEGEIMRPTGLAIDRRSGIVYVVDTLGHKVYRYGTDGKRKGSIGKRGEGDGEFNFPSHAFVDGAGLLYVTDFLNFRVQVFDPDGRFITKVGTAGDSYDSFDKPKGVATDKEGHIYVVDGGSDMVKIFDRSGKLLMFFGQKGHNYGDFYMPTGIFIDGKDRIYVADTINGRVEAFQFLGGD